MSHELSVSIARRGAKVDLDMESAAFGVISIDGELIPAEERPGTAKKLLASSALYCYCAALDKALETRSAKYRRIEGKATVRTGTDDKGRGRVTGIDLDVGWVAKNKRILPEIAGRFINLMASRELGREEQ